MLKLQACSVTLRDLNLTLNASPYPCSNTIIPLRTVCCLRKGKWASFTNILIFKLADTMKVFLEIIINYILLKTIILKIIAK